VGARHAALTRPIKTLENNTPTRQHRVQNLQNFRWEAEEIDRQLDRYMVDAWRAIRRVQHERGGDKGASLRAAAYVLAVQRVCEAERHRGFD